MTKKECVDKVYRYADAIAANETGWGMVMKAEDFDEAKEFLMSNRVSIDDGIDMPRFILAMITIAEYEEKITQ